MKVVILAGGRGIRINEESQTRPKPMIEIGDKPILWHIMKIYSSYGFNDFVICLGYKGNMIKDYFVNYYMYESDVTVDMQNQAVETHGNGVEPWKVTLVNTGLDTNTSGRIRRIQKYIGDEPFLLTYGDGVANVDINEVIRFHKKHGKTLTITAAKPAGRWGTLQINDSDDLVNSFKEKENELDSWVNAGFAVCEPKLFDYLIDDNQQLEMGPYVELSNDNEMVAYKHKGFWYPMDTLRDRDVLEGYWALDNAPWKIW